MLYGEAVKRIRSVFEEINHRKPFENKVLRVGKTYREGHITPSPLYDG